MGFLRNGISRKPLRSLEIMGTIMIKEKVGIGFNFHSFISTFTKKMQLIEDPKIVGKPLEEKLTNLKSVRDIIVNDLGVGSVVYSPIFGEIKFVGYSNQLQFITIETGQSVVFCDDGRFNKGGDIMLFPSKENRDWTTVPIKYPATIQDLEYYIINHIPEHSYKGEWTLKELRDIHDRNLIHYLQVLSRYLDLFTENYVANKVEYYDYEVYPTWDSIDKPDLGLHWRINLLRRKYSILPFRYKKAAEEFIRLTKDFLPILCNNSDTGIFVFIWPR